MSKTYLDSSIYSDCYLYAVKRNFLRTAVILLSAIIGWMMGYLRLPQTERVNSFIIGFGACLGILLFIAVFRTMWLKKVVKRGKSKSHQGGKEAPIDRTGVLMGTILLITILVGMVAAAYLFQRQSTIVQELEDRRLAQTRELAQTTQAIRTSRQVELMSRILEDVESEAGRNPNRSISSATIAKISALCYSFKPYRIVSSDTFSTDELSPERGYLLLALSRINIDTSSLSELYSKVSFERADLRNADLSSAQLPHINLKRANLNGADFSGSNMQFANLFEATCFGTNFNKSNLRSSYLRKSYCGWATFNRSDLKGSNFNGANFENAQMRDADVSNAMMQWAFFDGIVAVGANFSGTDLTRTDMNYAVLNDANFSKSRFFKVATNESSIQNVRFDSTEVHKEWLEWIRDSDVSGSDEILRTTAVRGDSSDPKSYPKYFIIKK